MEGARKKWTDKVKRKSEDNGNKNLVCSGQRTKGIEDNTGSHDP